MAGHNVPSIVGEGDGVGVEVAGDLAVGLVAVVERLSIGRGPRQTKNWISILPASGPSSTFG